MTWRCWKSRLRRKAWYECWPPIDWHRLIFPRGIKLA